MIICGIKFTHDAAVAVIEDNKLLFCVELEKIDNAPRHTTAKTMAQVARILQQQGIDRVDVTVIDGWKHGKIPLDDNPAEPVSPYHEYDVEPPLPQLLSRKILTTGIVSYPHIAGHVLAAYATSSLAPRRQPAYIAVWDGGMQPRVYYLDPSRKVVQTCALGFPLHGIIYTVMGLYFGPYRNEDITTYMGEAWSPVMRAHPAYALSGKVMAYIAKGQPSLSLVNRLDDMLEEIPQPPNQYAYNKTWIVENRLMRSIVQWRAMYAQDLRDADVLASIHMWLGNKLCNFFTDAVPQGADLIFTGGCALNIKWNAQLRDCGHFKSVWVPPFPNDCGNAIGAAMCEQVAQSDEWALEWSVYRGPQLRTTGEPLPAGWHAEACSIDRLAGLLHSDPLRPIVVLHEAAELGPRALGHRSILCAATSAQNRDTLNKMKGREDFRPVAPMCLVEDAPLYFIPGTPDPYMLFEHQATERAKHVAPAICHLDGTARLQTVSESDSPMLRALLLAYKRVSGLSILCNTSANYPGRGFFPDVRSAIEWGRCDRVWSGNTLYVKTLLMGEASQPTGSAADILDKMARTYRERNKLYGDNYKAFGHIMVAMFPGGLTVETAEEWNRLALFIHVVSKMTRYALNFKKGGHLDSAHDAGVYSAMLEELTQED